MSGPYLAHISFNPIIVTVIWVSSVAFFITSKRYLKTGSFNFWKYFQLKKVHYIFITRLKHAPADIALKYWWFKNNQWFVTHSLAVSVRLILHLHLHRLSSTTCNSSFFFDKLKKTIILMLCTTFVNEQISCKVKKFLAWKHRCICKNSHKKGIRLNNPYQ